MNIMKKICIVYNRGKDPKGVKTRELIDALESAGISYLVAPLPADRNQYLYVDPSCVDEDCECVISLGGDGTLIGVARDLLDKHIPLIGINIGDLGYLTEIDSQGISEAVKRLAEDDYYLEDRMMICGSIYHSDGTVTDNVAFNDVVVGRADRFQITTINLYVNGNLLNTYNADGLIISTPTGSTAYNLAAGGPVIEPTASLFAVTPICSHNLGVRSIVLSGDDVLEIAAPMQIKHKRVHVSISFDGKATYTLEPDDRIRIVSSESRVPLVKLSKASFLETLRRKMQPKEGIL